MSFASNLPHPLLPLTLAIGLACSTASQAQERGIEELSVVGRQLNLVGSATSASQGQISASTASTRRAYPPIGPARHSGRKICAARLACAMTDSTSM